MLNGDTVILRARRRGDLEVLHLAFDADPALHAVVDENAWRPVALEHRLAVFDQRLSTEPDPTSVTFTVQRRDDPGERCLGSTTLWGIDLHNRCAHLGISLVPQAQGQGLGREALELTLGYAFDHRDLHSVQLETLATNTGMQALAASAGFALEGRRREIAFVVGRRVDELLYGLLASQWRAGRPTASGTPYASQP